MFGRIIRAIERAYVYFPERTLKGTPEHIGLHYEEVWFRAEDGTLLNGWWIPGPNGEAGRGDARAGRPAPHIAWLFCHGNGGNLSARLDQLLEIHRRLGASIFIFDYRGYGLSEGAPSEEGTLMDARAAWREMRARLGPSHGLVVYFGRSMGGDIAARLAAERPPSALILESPPPSIPDVAHLHVRWMWFWPLKLLMRTRYETVRHIRRVHVPVLLIQGDRDTTVPEKFARRVFRAANDPKQWLLVPDAGHNLADQADPDLYYTAVRDFLTRYGTKTEAPKE
jgi:hypothetical protein